MEKIIQRFVGFYLNITSIFPKYNQELSFKLLCTVKTPPLKPTTVAFFETGTTLFLPTSRKTNVALHSWGKGYKKILFLHGWKSNSKQWQPYVEQLDVNEYTIYALDAPAHGASKGNHLNVELYRESIELAVNHIGKVNCAICHSLGCLSTSYSFLVNHEISIDSYVIMGASFGVDAILDYFRDMLSLSQKAIKNLRIKINNVLKLPYDEVTLQQFFERVNKPCIVIHEISDRVTPIAPIKTAIEHLSHIDRVYTNNQDY